MNSIYKFFKSIRLAVVLILVIILFALLSTLIPQGKSVEEYKAMYSPVLYWLVTTSGLQNYTSALLFWVPLVLFVLNLGVCTIDRLVSRARRKAAKHFGPDLIHVGLLILAVGAIITASVRREQDFEMSVGDKVNLPGGYSMSLADFQYLQYPDGRPKAWISTVDVDKDGQAFRKGVKIEVNHPLAIGLLKVYQTNYGTEVSVDFVDASGQTATMHRGEGFRMGSGELMLSSAQRMGGPDSPWAAVFQEYSGGKAGQMSLLRQGEKIGDYTAAKISARDFTGLRAATDPGFIPVLIALIVASAGLVMTSYNKSKGVI